MESKVAALRLDKQHETPEGEALHISSFVIVKDGNKILMLRTADHKGNLHWHLPARLLKYGENQDEAAKLIAEEWLGLDNIPEFVKAMNFLGHHWDICFVYEVEANKIKTNRTSEYRFFKMDEIPWDDIGSGHADVLKEL